MPIIGQTKWGNIEHIDGSRRGTSAKTIIYTDIAVTDATGTATLYLTDDRTDAGRAIFSSIENVQSKSEYYTDDPTQMPSSSIKYQSPDNKYIIFNITTGTIVYATLLSGIKRTAPVGIEVNVTVIGIENND